MSLQEVTPEDVMLRHPCRVIVAGPSTSGKSELVRRLLLSVEECFTGLPNFPVKAKWVFGIYSQLYSSPLSTPYVQVEFTNQFPAPDDDDFQILIIDDMMGSMVNDERLASTFTRDSHHKSFSVFFLVQDVFASGKFMRTSSLNANYFILMRQKRDLTQIKRLGSQLFPGSTNFFMDAFKKATSLHKFSYLLIDLHRDTHESLALRSSITPSEYPISIFINDEISNTKK